MKFFMVRNTVRNGQSWCSTVICRKRGAFEMQFHLLVVSVFLKTCVRDTAPPLFLDQNEARRAEKNFFKTGTPLISRSGWLSPPIWRSGSATGFLYSYAVYRQLLRHLKKDREVTTVFKISPYKLPTQSLPRSMDSMSGRCQRIVIDPSCLFWVPYRVWFNENTVTGPTSLALVLFWKDWRVYLFLKVEQSYSPFASFPQLFEAPTKCCSGRKSN